MRGIPTTVGTREDIENLAWDLPPARARAFLDGLGAEEIAGKMSPLEFQQLKSRVGHARWKAEAAADQRRSLGMEKERLTIRLGQLKKSRDRAMVALREAGRRVTAAEAQLLQIDQSLAATTKEVK